jgi:membrane fusion protein (multidrug efflux system)
MMGQSISLRSFVVAAVCGACVLLSACRESHSQDKSNGATPQVVVVTLKTQPVTLTRELPGRARAFLVAEVRPQVSGIIKRRLFVEGGHVKAGQPLYELEDAIYRAQHESAEASLLKAQATLHAAQRAAARSRELFGVNLVSAQDNEKAIATEAQAQADVALARAAVDSSSVNLAYAHIVAPISGRIGKSNVTQGALVTADQAQVLVSIQQLDPIYVEVNQSSSNWLTLKQASDAGRLRMDDSGATAKILLENGTVYDYDGKLQFTDVTVDPATGNCLLRIIVPNPKLLLLPGMYVRAVVEEGALSEAVLVPQQAVTRDPKGNASALVVGKEGRVESRFLHVSRAVGDQWLVEDGMVAGDRVIVEGVQKVEPGTSVQVLEQTAANTVGAGN